MCKVKCGRLWRWVVTSAAFVFMQGMAGDAVAQIPDSIDLEAVQDNTLYEDIGGALSNGAGHSLFVGRVAPLGGGNARRSVLQFDLSGIPAEATITGADLKLFMSVTIAGPTDVTAHRLLASWGEGTSNAANNEGQGAPAAAGDATWVHRFYFDSAWTTPGGDYVPAASATQSVGGSGPYHWSGPGLVADIAVWYQHPDSNFGWIVIGREDTITTAKRFVSRTGVPVTERPLLHISWTLPCPVLKTGDVNTDGNLTSSDIIGLVNFIFKSGAHPQPCDAAADVNCTGTVTSADIISMVNHVFKGGAAPCDVCTLIPGLWSCP